MMEELIDGLLLGMFHLNIPDINNCFNATEAMVSDIKGTIQSFGGSSGDLSAAFNFISELGSLLGYAGQAVTSCMNSGIDLKDLYEIEAKLLNGSAINSVITTNLKSDGLSIMGQL